jgi:hypothetical protein
MANKYLGKKKFNYFSHLGNANQNYIEISSDPIRMSIIKKKKKKKPPPNADEDGEPGNGEVKGGNS